MRKKIAILGSTGSIGRQSLDVARNMQYEVVALSCGGSVNLLEKQVREFLPKQVAVADDYAAEILKSRLANLPNPPEILKGKDGAKNLVNTTNAQIVLNAIVGIAGLSSTLAGLKRGLSVALANKESLVAGGKLVMQAAKKSGAMLLPVDSEHSAIFQCLQDSHAKNAVAKILLTASGGPFYGKTTAQLKEVTKKDALNHPNWSMGQKITVDSATMMNKGLEFIEAMWLFEVEPEQIEIVVQRQSVVHSMVQFADNSILAQMGTPDMRLPIQYALTWPLRFFCPAPALNFTQIANLHFGMADEETFRCLAACKKAAEKGGLFPCAANGANEEAVKLFLEDAISFLDIGRLVEGCVDSGSFAGDYDLKDVYQCDEAARKYVRENARR